MTADRYSIVFIFGSIIQQFVADFIADWLTIINVHELIHSLELQQCAFLPIFYQLHKTQSFVWFCSYLI